jgi:hypothetical protein
MAEAALAEVAMVRGVVGAGVWVEAASVEEAAVADMILF